MKISIAAILMGIAFVTSARAQAPAATTSAPPSPTKGYAEVVAQSAFGNVTSQSFGGEIGVAVAPNLQVFVDAGQVRDASPASLGANAQKIASGVAALAGGADYHVKQPVTFGVAGIKYVVPTGNSRIEPYVMGGGGVAQVKRDVTFTTPAGDISQFATIGTDLSGNETKGMISVGGGVGVPVSTRVVVDLQYRYGRVFTSGEGLNINRAGIGVGVRF
jgi:opacity protein-like surface antigen